jgi:hypothetical protein
MAMSVTSRPTNTTKELNTIVKIYKYRRFHERHHFILMVMKVHDTFKRDMDNFIRECVRFFHDKRLGGHLFLSFCI